MGRIGPLQSTLDGKTYPYGEQPQLKFSGKHTHTYTHKQEVIITASQAISYTHEGVDAN